MARKTGSAASTIIACVLAWFSIVLVAVLAIQELKAPAPEAATAPANKFSAERAMVHVRAIASVPHPLGSDANKTVRNYLLAQLSSLGLNPQVFDGTGTAHFGSSVVIAHTRDILGRLPGSANSGAIMLVGHYDSVSTAPGAADDGAAVAAILEAVRALRAGPGLKNDLIVLFTEGEESGLLGADAFAASHPWMKDVALLLNFEARGNRGPSMLFETSPGNATLIEAAAHTPRPVGSSLFYSLYKLLPNNTDFTVFRRYKIPGLNFAFGENLEAYHSRLDTADNLSLGSVQHHGSYALGLVQQFGQMDLSGLKKQTGDDVFFDWLGGSMITYSERWVLPGELLATLLLVLLIVLNLRGSKVRPARLIFALGASLSIVLAIPVVLVVTQWLLSRLLAGHIIAADARANSYLLTGHILLGFCVGGLLLELAGFRKRLSVLELALSGLILLVLLTWLLVLALPAGSYLLFWPPLLAMLGLLLITFAGRSAQSVAQGFATLPAAAVAILLFAPLIYLLYVFLTLQLITAAAVGILVGIFFVVALPFLNAAIPPGRSRLVLLILLAGALATFTIGDRLSRYTPEHPRRDTVLYSLNADSHSAEWISYDGFLDPWTTRIFGLEKPQSRPMPDYLAGSQRPVLSAPAPALDLLPPVAEVKADEKDGDIRKLRLSVRSQRNANVLRLSFSKDAQLVSIRCGGREISSTSNSPIVNISLLGMDANGTDLELTVKSTGKISFWLADQSYGLPAGVPPRLEEDAASIYAPTDQIWVCRKLTVDGKNKN